MSIYEDMQRAQALRAELRALEQKVERAATKAPITVEDELEMNATQARMDTAYQAVDRRCPPPLPYEGKGEYRRRIIDGLKIYCDQWRAADTFAISDAAVPIMEKMVSDAARAAGPTFALRDGQIKARQVEGPNGHKTIEWVGKDAHFTEQFKAPVFRGLMKSRDEYAAMSRDAQLARITEVVRHRPVPQPRAGF